MGASLGQRKEYERRKALVLEVLKDGPLDGNSLREKTGISKGEFIRVARRMRDERLIVMKGIKRSARWSLGLGSWKPSKKVDRRTVNGRMNGPTVTNTRPAKTNGQVETAVTELREIIGRKQAEIENLSQALVILEASL